MRIATLDIGTNSVVFLVADGGAEGLRAVLDEAHICRLGEGVDRTGELRPEAIERTLAVLERCVRRAAELGAEHVAAVGTQALREAKNGRDFLVRAREILGEDVEIIAGEREARLSWRAATSSFELPPDGRRTVIDIGGGSTELLVGGAAPGTVASIAIGSVRLTERLVKGDPPTDAEKAALASAIDAALAAGPLPEGQLIGVAGTVTTLCAIALGLHTYDGARVHGTRMTRAQVEEVVDRLGRMTLAERHGLAGLEPLRADVIFAGGMILSRILVRAGAEELLVCDRGIRWGLAEEIVGYRR